MPQYGSFDLLYSDFRHKFEADNLVFTKNMFLAYNKLGHTKRQIV